MSASRKPQAASAFLALTLGAVFPASPVVAADWYVAPCPTPPCGNGSLGNPWDLQTALSHPAQVQAGDTIWLRGGVYQGGDPCGNPPEETYLFCSQLAGTEQKPIIVRSYGAEWAVIDAGQFNGTAALVVNGEYSWYMSFEIRGAPTDRVSTYGWSTPPPDIDTTTAINMVTTPPAHRGLKFVNLVIHDTAAGFTSGVAVPDVEFYGNILYYIGWDAPDRGHGHGIYPQNSDLAVSKRMLDNIAFAQFGSGIHAYSEMPGELANIEAEGNIAFNNGVLSSHGYQDNILVAGDGSLQADYSKLESNFTYFAADGTNSGRNRIGYEGTVLDAVILGNYFINAHGESANAMQFKEPPGSVAAIEDNVFYGHTRGDHGEETLQYWRDHPELGNLFYNPPSGSPTGVHAFVRPNQYETGRGHVVVYNWGHPPYPPPVNVSVDVSSVLAPGDLYHVYDVQNYFGPPVAMGLYTGFGITIPMGDASAPVAIPSGVPAPPHTPRQFGAFVIKRVFQEQNAPGPE